LINITSKTKMLPETVKYSVVKWFVFD